VVRGEAERGRGKRVYGDRVCGIRRGKRVYGDRVCGIRRGKRVYGEEREYTATECAVGGREA
jgi:hypothetical protein